MNRIKAVQSYINNIFDNIKEPAEQRAAYIHSYGVSQLCALLAQQKGLDVEIAAAVGLLHDVYSYKTGIRSLHGHNGSEMIRVAFKYELKGLFSPQEQLIIKSAVYHHSDKEHLHDEYDELLKDSDVLQHYLYDTSEDLYVSRRLVRAATQLKITLSESVKTEMRKAEPFEQKRAGDIAEELAQKKIAGTRDDPFYMDIIKYFPENSAFSELDHAWCAAFVYHCCRKAGLVLPIRIPNNAENPVNCRFACVVAWYEWAKANGYCFKEEEGFFPQRGDIVVYNNIIPKECKAENSAWCDHIGIVTGCEKDFLIVAEGNVGNKNVSGILKREHNETIGCYIRIPSDYNYDVWKVDYKSGKLREELYAG